jgi:hypothetical protein
MFFRRQTPHEFTFAERLDRLTQAGFDVKTRGAQQAVVTRNGCSAVVEEVPGSSPKISKAGILIGGEIASLVDVGYQKVWRTPGGRNEPALAFQLQELHGFQEDLREGLGMPSLYNESLGTVNDDHLYDRVVGRDEGVRRHPWERE